MTKEDLDQPKLPYFQKPEESQSPDSKNNPVPEKPSSETIKSADGQLTETEIREEIQKCPRCEEVGICGAHKKMLENAKS